MTSEQEIENEISIIHRLFEEGLSVLHIRKPHLSQSSYATFISKIDSQFHRQLMIHSHHQLQNQFDLRGLHFPAAQHDFIIKEKKPSFIISTSFHSVNEIIEAQDLPIDYAFLSPIFNSISKLGYTGQNFNISSLATIFPIVALGGIDIQNSKQLTSLGFDRAALLGYIWRNENPVEAFKKIKNGA